MEWLSGYVLHKRPYRETSALVDVFTLEQGKVSAVAKGMHSQKSERKGLLQLFQPVKLQLYGKSQLRSIGSVESAGSAHNFAHAYLFSAMYINEVLNRCLPAFVPQAHVFAYYQALLTRLNEQHNIEITLREFELSLLSELGFEINFESDWITEEPLLANQHYVFDNEHGFSLSQQKIRHSYAGQALLDMSARSWNEQSLAVAKQLTRKALLPLIGDKPIKSRELFLGVQAHE